MSAGERGAAAEARRLFRARDAFQCPELDVRMKKYLVRLANETANHLIQDTLEPNTRGVKVGSGDEDDKDDDDGADDDDGDVDPRAAATNGLVWKKLSVIKGIQLLRGYDVVLAEDGRAKDVACCLRGLSVVNASIEEFAMLFKLDTNRNVATEHGLLFNPDLLDMATLYALVQPSGDHPRRYVGIKWCLVQSPSKLFRNRDFCYLECQKEFRDAHGRRGWVRSMHSIKMPCCPSLEKTHGIVRASMYRCGLVAVETKKPGVLRVTYTVEMDLKGHFPEIFQPNFLAQRIASLASIDKFLQQQRLSSSPLLGDLDIPASKKSKASCHFCYRNFSMLLRKHVCRKCGECVCKNCSSDWDLDVPVIGRKKVRICTVCSVGARFSHVTAPTSADGYIVDRQTSATAAVPPQRQHREEIEAQTARPHQRRSLSFSSPSDFHHLHYQQQQQQQQHHYGQRNEEQRFQSIQFGRPTATRKSRRASQPDPHPYQPSHFVHHASRQEPEFRPAHEYRGTNDMLDFEEFTMDGGVGGHNVRATTDLTGMWDPREDGLPTPMDSPASYFGIKHRATSEFEQQAPQYNHHSSQQVGPSRESILFQQQAEYEEPPSDSFSEHRQSDLPNRYPPPQRRHTANYTSLVQQQQHQQYLRRHDLHHEQHNPYFGHPQEPEHQQQYQEQYQQQYQQQQQARRRQQSYPSAAGHNSRQPRATENYPQQRHRQQSDTEMYFPPTQVNGTNRNFALEFFKEQYKNSTKQQHNEQRTSEQSRPAQPHPFMQLPAQQLQTDHHSIRRSTRPSSVPSSRPSFQHNVQRTRSNNRAHEEQRQPDPPLSPDQTQTPGEVIEYVETEDGEWVEQRHTIDFPIPECERAVPRSVSIGEDSEDEEDNSMHLNPGYCIHCGSKRVVRNGVIEAACICELTRIQAPKAASGAFDPEDRDMDQSPVPQRRKHAADDGDHVVPLLVGRTSQQTTTLYGRMPHKTHSSYAE